MNSRWNLLVDTDLFAKNRIAIENTDTIVSEFATCNTLVESCIV